MSEFTLPIIDAVDDHRESNQVQHERLQKTLRVGMNNITKSIDRLHASISSMHRLQTPASTDGLAPSTGMLQPGSTGGKSGGEDLLHQRIQSLFQFMSASKSGQIAGEMAESLLNQEEQGKLQTQQLEGQTQYFKRYSLIQEKSTEALIGQVAMFQKMHEEFLNISAKLTDIRAAVTNQMKFWSQRLREGGGTMGAGTEDIGISKKLGRLHELAGYTKSIGITEAKYDPEFEAKGVDKSREAYNDILNAIRDAGGDNTDELVDALNTNTNAQKDINKQEVKRYKDESMLFGKAGIFGDLNKKLSGVGDGLKGVKDELEYLGTEGVVSKMFGGLGGLLGAPGKKLFEFTSRGLFKAASMLGGWPVLAAAIAGVAGLMWADEKLQGMGAESVRESIKDPTKHAKESLNMQGGAVNQLTFGGVQQLDKNNEIENQMAMQMLNERGLEATEENLRSLKKEAQDIMSRLSVGDDPMDGFESFMEPLSDNERTMYENARKRVEGIWAVEEAKMLQEKLKKGKGTEDDLNRLQMLQETIQRNIPSSIEASKPPIAPRLNEQSVEQAKPQAQVIPVPAGGGETNVAFNSVDNGTRINAPLDAKPNRITWPDASPYMYGRGVVA